MTTMTPSPKTIQAPAVTTDSTKVGVIIPVYNRPRVVLDAIACVARQTRKPHRLVIVDDGSTDDTAANIEARIAELQPRFEVRLITQSNQGVAAARNRAAQELTDCDLLAMLDSDDQWSNNYLECMTPLFDDPAVVAASCDAVYVDAETGSRRSRDMRIYETDTTRRIFLYGPPATPGTMIRRQAFEAVGGFNETLAVGEDTALFLRLSLKGRWAWGRGALLTVGRGSILRDCEAEHLTRAADVADDFRRVMDLDRFIHENAGATIRWHVWRRELGAQWIGQARRLLDRGASGEAAWCYRRALAATPWSLRAWRGYLFSANMKRPTTPVQPH